MRFEARDLKPYADPVSAEDLEEGTVYFAVTFTDEEMLIPCLEPLVFVGWNLDGGGAGTGYFQDPESYHKGIRFESASPSHPAVFHTGSAKQINHIFEYEDALEILMACSLRRKA